MIVPQKLDEWNLDVLTELIKYKDVESSSLDFTEEVKGLRQGACAMANTRGGFIICGIEEVREKSGQNRALLGFKMKGFGIGQEDNIKKDVANELLNVEPLITYNTKTISNGESFYLVVEIKREESKLPYFLKGEGKCMVRLDNTNRPGDRYIVLNLFSNQLQRRTDVQQLREATTLFKQLLHEATKEISTLRNGRKIVPLVPVDVTFVESAMLRAGWFLNEKNLLGGYSQNLMSSFYGLYSVIAEVERLNTLIRQYNFEADPSPGLRNQLQLWEAMQSNSKTVIQHLDKVLSDCDTYLSAESS